MEGCAKCTIWMCGDMQLLMVLAAGIPIACRVTLSRNTFKKGQFHLGRFSQVACWAAVLGICFNTVRSP